MKKHSKLQRTPLKQSELTDEAMEEALLEMRSICDEQEIRAREIFDQIATHFPNSATPEVESLALASWLECKKSGNNHEQCYAYTKVFIYGYFTAIFTERERRRKMGAN